MKKNTIKCRMAGALLVGAWALGAVAAPDTTDEASELQDLLEVLDQQTEIATKTKLNADYVPGLVTVLHADELSALGIRTVWEALRLVPGIEPSIDQIGGRQTLVRGVGGSFASGNMKILLNGRSMNSALSANANPVLNMPVAQIDHIEVVRGPGSAVHGEFAYAGVLNVITRKTTDGAFLRVDSADTYTGGGFAHWQSADGRSGGSINAGGWVRQGGDIETGRDALYNGFNAHPVLNPLAAQLTNAPGPVNDAMEQRSVLVDLYRDTLSLSLVYVEDGNGDHYGTINVLSDNAARGIDYRNRYFMVSGQGRWDLTEHVDLNATVGWQQYTNHFDIRLLPAGFLWFTRFGVPTPLPDGYVSEGYYEESRTWGNVDFVWDGWTDHRWLMSVGLTRIDVNDSWQRNNVGPLTDTPVAVQKYTAEDGVPWPSEKRDRQIVSVTLQDEYRLNDDVTITAGVRHDDYDDFGENTSPRLAGVWRLGRAHVLKAQYAEAFRPPTFYETAFTPELDPETIRTTELAYIYKSPATDFRATAFRSRMRDLIVGSGILGYSNADEIRSRGVEFEVRQRLGVRWRVDANLTLTDSEQVDTGDDVAGAADRLANLVLRYEPSARHQYALWVRHVGERTREAGDDRANVDGYETVDISAGFQWPDVSGARLSLGIRNLFDRDVRNPAPLTRDIINQPIYSYENDYPQPGRTAWLELAWRL